MFQNEVYGCINIQEKMTHEISTITVEAEEINQLLNTDGLPPAKKKRKTLGTLLRTMNKMKKHLGPAAGREGDRDKPKTDS